MNNITKTNFQMVKELDKVFKPVKRGLLSYEEVELVKTTLCIDDTTDILSLRNLRDFVVLYFSHKSDKMAADGHDLEMDKVSGITSVIDHRIFALGGEV